MAIDPAVFALNCVRWGLFCGINPHYVLGVGKLRSGISDDSKDGKIGPFRLTQTEWDANRTDDDFNFDFLPEDINQFDMQCAVFALMAHRAYDVFAQTNNNEPSALQLYLQQWPDAQSPSLAADFQKALDDTAALLDPAAAKVPGAVLPGPIANPGSSNTHAISGPTLQKLRAANVRRAQNVQITRNIADFDGVARRLVAPAAKQQYQAISDLTQVPWFVIAVIHEREASQKFSCSIAQGDPWDKVSVNIPRGRGPFANFQDAALDALIKCAPHAARWGDWSFGGSMTLLEQYNGLGYANRDLPSPYIWAGTNQYVRGKFIRDHVFDPNTVDSQLGCAGMLIRMQTMDPTITFPNP